MAVTHSPRSPVRPGLRSLLDTIASSNSVLAPLQQLSALREAASGTRPGDAVSLLEPVIESHQSDPLAAYLAVHALGAVRTPEAGAALLHWLRAGDPGLQEHAAWTLMHHEPTADAVPRLRELAGQGGFTQMLADLTLETWGSRQPLLVGRSGNGRAEEISRLEPRMPIRQRPSRPWPGIRIAQVLMQGRIDGDLTAGGSGDGGGLATLQVGLTRRLANHDQVAEAFLLTRAIEGEGPGFAAPRETIGSGATIVRLGFGPEGYVPTAEMWPYRPELEAHLRRFLVREGPFDALHLRFADVGTFAASRVAHELGIPIFFTLAPDPHALIERAETDGTLTRDNFGDIDREQHLVFRTWLVNWMLGHAQRLALLPRSGHVEQFRRLMGIDVSERPDRYAVIAEGIDTTSRSKQVRTDGDPVIDALEAAIGALPGERHGLPLLVSVGRLNRVKGFDRLVRAWAGDSTLSERFNLVIVGGNLDHPSPEEAATLASIEAATREGETAPILFGHQAHDDVVRLLALAERGHGELVAGNGIYACASEKEEFGLAILEALAAGLPVIAPRVGGPSTYLDHMFTGFLADTTDVADLRRGLAWADRVRFSEVRTDAARRLVRDRYSLDAMADELVFLYSLETLEESVE
jgi:glycosyltransferase involved in cell wall biosynthesis